MKKGNSWRKKNGKRRFPEFASINEKLPVPLFQLYQRKNRYMFDDIDIVLSKR
jgi:uncharacterized protein YkuJ